MDCSCSWHLSMVGMRSTNLFFLSSRFKDLRAGLDTNLGSNANWFLCLHLVVIAFSTEGVKKSPFQQIKWRMEKLSCTTGAKVPALPPLCPTYSSPPLLQLFHNAHIPSWDTLPCRLLAVLVHVLDKKFGFSCGINTTSMRLCSHQIRCCVESQQGCVATMQHWGGSHIFNTKGTTVWREIVSSAVIVLVSDPKDMLLTAVLWHRQLRSKYWDGFNFRHQWSLWRLPVTTHTAGPQWVWLRRNGKHCFFNRFGVNPHKCLLSWVIS